MMVILRVLFCVFCSTVESQATSIISWSPTVTADSNSDNYSRGSVTCPPDKPFELKNGTHNTCVVSCGPKLVSEGSKCINITECTKSVLSDGKCMDRCPEGYVYVDVDYNYDCGSDCSYTMDDIKQSPCVKRIYLIARVVLFIVLTILYIIFIMAFFSTRRISATKLINWFKRATKKDTRLVDEELLVNDDGAEN